MTVKNILLVSHADFPQNSAIHVHYFANGLVTLGLDCIVAVPHYKNNVSTIGHNNLYKVIQFNELERLIDLFDNQRGPDVVHAWTPREHVRKFCAQLEEQFRFKLVIHLEDNEERILEGTFKQSIKDLIQSNSDSVSPILSHPKNYQDFLNSADGVTVIMDRLSELVSDRIPTITLWPGVDRQQFFPRPANIALAKELGIPTGSTVVCYTGNIHLLNAEEMRILYLTVGKRNLQNKPTVLVRTGVDYCDLLDADEAWVRKHIIELGFVERGKIADLLALADVLVQPGQPDPFNDYRFPSKIPEFLAMGKPVILPATNIGRFLTHRKQAIVLPIIDEISLSDAIDQVIENHDLAQTLAEGALQFVKSNLDWHEKSQKLKAFYETLFIQPDENQIASLRQAFGRMQRQAQDLREELEHTQTQLHHTQTQLHHTQVELGTTQTQLHHTQAELGTTQTQLHHTQIQLHQAQTELVEAQAVILAMESSKFWKLRRIWIDSKRFFVEKVIGSSSQ